MKHLNRSIQLQFPRDFDFWSTVWSSGWCGLAPFSFDEERRTLSRVHGLTSGKTVEMTMMARRGRVLALEVGSREELGKADVEEIEGIVRTCLRLDEDLSSFFELLEWYPDFAWVREMGAGRSIRSPTVFEDVVKTICSTNCSWALTKAVSGRLCRILGEPYSEDLCTFPTPHRMASTT